MAEGEHRGRVDVADLVALPERRGEVGGRLAGALGREADRQPPGRVDPPAQDVGQRGGALLAREEAAHDGGEPVDLARQFVGPPDEQDEHDRRARRDQRLEQFGLPAG